MLGIIKKNVFIVLLSSIVNASNLTKSVFVIQSEIYQSIYNY